MNFQDPKYIRKLEREYLAMLSYARPRDSECETEFVKRFIEPLGFHMDEHGNMVLCIPRTDGTIPDTMFASHYDTVAWKEGIQTLSYDGQSVRLSKKSKQEGFGCLGADDTSGIFLMLEMVKANVPGYYVIHYGEESGCIGSGLLANSGAEYLKGINKCISFDRKGTNDIITHQCSLRTASDAFAKSLADALGMGHMPSSKGVYTDSNEYRGIIPECTNVAVGYYGQHGKEETQDVTYLLILLSRLLEVDWDSLAVERDPAQDDEAWGGWMSSISSRRSNRQNDMDDMADHIATNPEVVASLLMSYGVTLDDLLYEIEMHRFSY